MSYVLFEGKFRFYRPLILSQYIFRRGLNQSRISLEVALHDILHCLFTLALLLCSFTEPQPILNERH